MTKYYPEIRFSDEDFDFLENLRIKEARNWTRENRDLGIYALEDAHAEHKDKGISDKLSALIRTEYEAWDKSVKNVRRSVEKIWMYPLVGYPDWKQVDDKAQALVIKACEASLEKVKPKLVLYKRRKVYLILDGFTRILADYINGSYDSLIPGLTLEPNITDTDHITVLRDSEVDEAKYDGKDIEEWNKKKWNVKFTKVIHTCSLDWARFSICVVVELECPEIDEYLKIFNDKHGTNIKPSKHIIIAIKSR